MGSVGRGLVVLACVALLVLLLAHSIRAAAAGWSDVDYMVGSIIGKLGELQRRGVNVSVYIDRVNDALRAAEGGDFDGAMSILVDVSSDVNGELVATAGAPLRLAVVKAVKVGLLLSIPVLVYLLLPRVYLLLWYRSRRDWMVEGARES